MNLLLVPVRLLLEPMAKRGRPSKFTPEIAQEICERLSEGEPLAVICRDEHMPTVQAIAAWREKDGEFSLSIARAREAGYDSIAYRLRKTARGEGDSTQDVQRDKLIIETDLKLLAKWAPRRYGDKIEHEVTGGQILKIKIGGAQ